jgi:basic membrane protein A
MKHRYIKQKIKGTLIFLMAVSLSACGVKEEKNRQQAEENSAEESISKDGTYEIAFISGEGELDDAGFHESSWEGIAEYADENRITYSYYRPANDTRQAREEAVRTAAKKGAKIIISQGYPFEEVIAHMQNEYPKIQFLMLDAKPRKAGQKAELASNVHCILFREEEAGYLAGYAAVCEGYTRLGFLGGKEIAPVQRYGSGFIQGAEYAAMEMEREITLKYQYTDTFLPSDEVQQKSKEWYEDGVQVIFACNGGASVSVMQTAEELDGKVIGVDADQSAVSPTVLTSAGKNLKGAVTEALDTLYENGGQASRQEKRSHWEQKKKVSVCHRKKKRGVLKILRREITGKSIVDSNERNRRSYQGLQPCQRRRECIWSFQNR